MSGSWWEDPGRCEGGYRASRSAVYVRHIPPRDRHDGNTPSTGIRWGDSDFIWVDREEIHFCEEDWTGGIELKAQESFFRRSGEPGIYRQLPSLGWIGLILIDL